MQQNDVIAPVLSYEEINNRAENFLKKYGRENTISLFNNCRPIAQLQTCALRKDGDRQGKDRAKL